MPVQPAKETKPTSTKPANPAPLRLVPPSELVKRIEELQEEIAKRAFALFESNGRTIGRDLEDWFKAEAELLRPVPVKVAESDGNLIVRADVPGFSEEELQIALEPQRLTITGKHETTEEREEKDTRKKEVRSEQVLKVVELPVAVEAEKAAATLKGGVLELRVPKAAPAKKVEIHLAQPSRQDQEC